MKNQLSTLTSQPGAKHNIPHSISTFIGRGPELTRLQNLMGPTGGHLVSITGPGGSGKTRLALETARLVMAGFKDGAWWVDLAPVTNSGQGREELAQVVAQAVGVLQDHGDTLLSTLQNFLETKNLLLFLDNCEHLITECAALADDLLKSCPGLHILATSRERLGLDGEEILHLAPLALPERKPGLTTQELLNSEAAQLFIQRAQAVQPDFKPSSENAGTVAEICYQLDGLPLALELAAAKMRGLGVSNLASRLHDRFRLLTNENRLALPRQQTLQSLLDWSYNLLPERERTVFQRLAVFNGSIPLEAVEVVCAGPYESPNGRGKVESSQVLGLLLELVNKSFVQVEAEASEGVVRYRLLETMREYALQKLGGSPPAESTLVHRQLLDWCLQTAQEAQPGLESKEQAVWLQRLQKEHYHFSAALGWALALTDQQQIFEEAVRLTLALARYWQRQGLYLEGEKWSLDIMAHPGQEKLPPELRTELLHWAGILFNPQDAELARKLHLQTLDFYGEQGNLAGQVKSLTELAWQAFYQLENERANTYARQALALAGHLPTMSGQVDAYYIRAVTAERLGDYETAETCGEIALRFWRETGNTGSIASAANLLADIAANCQEFEKARVYLLENIDLQSKFDSPLSNWVCLKSVITFFLLWAKASGPDRESLPEIWTTIAGWLGAIGQAQSQLGGTPPPMTRQLFDGLIQSVRALMDPATFEAAYAQGRHHSLAEALAQARTMLLEIQTGSGSSINKPEPGGENGFEELTPRELETLRLLAKGLSNAALAQELSVTPRTVNAHLTSIYSKLALNSRAEAIRFAFENHLA